MTREPDARISSPSPRPGEPDRLRAVFDLSGDAIFILDAEGYLLDANRAACDRYGYTRGDLIGRHIREMYAPEESRCADGLMERLLRDGSLSFETVHRTKDGWPIPTEVKARSIRQGDTAFVIGICRDISMRVRAEDDLRTSNSLLAATLESTTDGILVVDDTGRICRQNRRFLEMWRIPEEVEAAGDDSLALSHAAGQLSDPASFMTKVQELYADKEAESFDVLEFRDGRVFERYSIPLRVEGRSVGRVWSFRDVTERKRMEKNQQIFASLVEHSTDLIGIASLDGKVLYMNKVGQEMAGLGGMEEVRGKRISDFALEKHRFPLQKMLDSLAGEGTWKGEARIRNFRTGAATPIEMHGFVIRDTETGQPIALANICRDISERKRMEEEMARADKLASIGVLAGGIAHDFNNLLTAIYGNITLAKMYANRHGEVYERLEESEKATLRARDLTQQLLTFSKGGAPIKRTLSIRELAKESAGFALRGSNVRCEFSSPEDLWPVEADEGQLCQVLNNLIINGAHAMNEGGTLQVCCGNLTVERGELPTAPGRYVRISVMDHGVGIPREHLSRIFDPYFTTKAKGSGLGLSTSYSIARNHGGHLTVESDPGIGTVFHVYLPASAGGKPAPKVEEERIAAGKGRVLVMDDEEPVRDVARSMLECIGYTVTVAKDGSEAIAAYRAAMDGGTPFDLVLMDLTIPGGMGGMEAVKKIREIDPRAKAIVCSGYSGDTIMANYRSHGFRGVVPKPYTLKCLSDTLLEVLSATA
jgi:PAS domain S-box-containing protein